MNNAELKEKNMYKKAGRGLVKREFGMSYSDTKKFDHLAELSKLGWKVGDIRISYVKLWQGSPDYHIKVLNGIQVEYENVSTNERHKTTELYGRDGLELTHQASFPEEDPIGLIGIRSAAMVDRLFLETESEKLFGLGGTGGELTLINLKDLNYYPLAFFGGIGGNMHSLGLYLFDRSTEGAEDLITKKISELC
eukprot:TRINITY_DN16250_c0_g1_i1.p1 TRINITY_DN16250_c0_g1~~TRINITY_DN16250_c0_g1_i1.p1  ORF type:complete len:194 (+),score=37.30 TRINITY_DN16250_c0_g1_i1:52-633(+)